MNQGLGESTALALLGDKDYEELNKPLPVSRQAAARLALKSPTNLPIYLLSKDPKLGSKVIPYSSLVGTIPGALIGSNIAKNEWKGALIGAGVGALGGGVASYIASKKAKKFYNNLLTDANLGSRYQ